MIYDNVLRLIMIGLRLYHDHYDLLYCICSHKSINGMNCICVHITVNE